MTHDRKRAAAAGLLAGLVVALATASPAIAHTELTATNPASGATVQAPIDEVTLTYSGAIRADGSTVTVTGADGTSYAEGPLTVIDTVVHRPVPALPSGTYTVQHRVIAADGHAMEGSFTFTVSLPPELEPTPSPTTQPEPTQAPDPSGPPGADDQLSDAGSSVGLWLGVASAAAALTVLVFLVRRRGQGQGRP